MSLGADTMQNFKVIENKFRIDGQSFINSMVTFKA